MIHLHSGAEFPGRIWVLFRAAPDLKIAIEESCYLPQIFGSGQPRIISV
jgi:hypothetical protein